MTTGASVTRTSVAIDVGGETGRNGRQLFQAARARERRQSTGVAIVALLFLYALGQVWLSTEVAERRSRVNGLRADLDQAAAEREVVDSRLRLTATYGELAEVGAACQLVADGAREEILLPAAPLATPPARTVQAGLLGFVPLVGDEAQAREVNGGNVPGR